MAVLRDATNTHVPCDGVLRKWAADRGEPNRAAKMFHAVGEGGRGVCSFRETDSMPYEPDVGRPLGAHGK